MDDKDKGIIQKTIEAVEEFASGGKGRRKTPDGSPRTLKARGRDCLLPGQDYGMFGPPPTQEFMVIHQPRKSRARRVAKNTAKKPANNSAKKKTANEPKKATSPAKKEAAKKVARKKKTKKSRR